MDYILPDKIRNYFIPKISEVYHTNNNLTRDEEFFEKKSKNKKSKPDSREITGSAEGLHIIV